MGLIEHLDTVCHSLASQEAVLKFGIEDGFHAMLAMFPVIAYWTKLSF